ncbi:MAG: hypothetical protein LC723_13205 [Actinobacteria bacterium]|nr:hypothetical protein [Actinomycetota bacterium]
MSTRIETPRQVALSGVSAPASSLDDQSQRRMPKRGELRPLARAFIELAMTLIEKKEPEQ